MEQIIDVKAIVNFAKPYRVAEGGTTNEGVTINYLMTDSFKPFEDETTGSQGYKNSKASISLELLDKLVAVPGFYKLSCTLGVNSQNQAQLKPVDIEFLQYCDLQFADNLESLSGAKAEVKSEPHKEAVKAEQKEKGAK